MQTLLFIAQYLGKKTKGGQEAKSIDRLAMKETVYKTYRDQNAGEHINGTNNKQNVRGE